MQIFITYNLWEKWTSLSCEFFFSIHNTMMVPMSTGWLSREEKRQTIGRLILAEVVFLTSAVKTSSLATLSVKGLRMRYSMRKVCGWPPSNPIRQPMLREEAVDESFWKWSAACGKAATGRFFPNWTWNLNSPFTTTNGTQMPWSY